MQAHSRFLRSLAARPALLAAVAALAVTVGHASAASQSHPIYYPHAPGTAPPDSNRPLNHVGTYQAQHLSHTPIVPGTWTDVAATLPFLNGPWAPMQMTDGTVIIEDYCTTPVTNQGAQWYRLTPDHNGSYTNGSWSALPPMPAGYSPLYFAQQILPDGRVIIEGGEYNATSGNNCGSATFTTQGAIYDPVANSWSSVVAPTGWTSIGDAQSIILPNGTYMLANCCDIPAQQAIGTIGTSVTWATSGSYACPSGDPCNADQGYTALYNGDVLTVDVWSTNGVYNDVETYNGTNWSLVASTADYLTDTTSRLMGPAALTPIYGTKGSIIQFTANATLAVNDKYDVFGNTWISGPVMHIGAIKYDCADAPAATLPDGNILVQASPGTFSTPSHFWEWRIRPTGMNAGTIHAVQVTDPAQAPSTSSFEGNLLVLPTGQVLWDNSQATPTKEVAVYTPVGHPRAAWRPVVSSVSNHLSVGSTGNAISGTNFNGFDLGGVYGNLAQQATNFPLVRITNNSTGHVCFGRSYNFSTMGTWTVGTTNAVFDLPACETGASKLQVIVNGIASAPVAVTVS